jgi:heptosyltransferase-1
MGDVIHTLPALTDAGKNISNIKFDWVVEENFAEIPTWHPLVDKVIPIAFRRWRKNVFAKKTWQAVTDFKDSVRSQKYDMIIDAQGLVKSALMARVAQGTVWGFDRKAARDPFASIFYHKKVSAPPVKQAHAIDRLRILFSEALQYSLPTGSPDYGVDPNQFGSNQEKNYLIFLHGTTWKTKHWPNQYWDELAKIAKQNDFPVKLLWGNAEEEARAKDIASRNSNVTVLPRLRLSEVVRVLANAKAVVAVDTGLGHLAAALSIPTLSLYGPTNAVLTGTQGGSQKHLSSTFACSPCLSRDCHYIKNAEKVEPINPPCFKELSPEKTWGLLSTFLR